MKERKPTGVIVDLDGTLADVTPYRHHVLTRPKDFHAFHTGAMDAEPIGSTLEWVTERHAAGHVILVVTARMSSWHHETTAWLHRHMPVPFHGPHMRGFRDYRPDYEIKYEILGHLRARFDIVEAIDDNPSVVEIWRSVGIPTTIVPGWAEEHPDEKAEEAR